MTRLELLRTGTAQEIAKTLCEEIDDWWADTIDAGKGIDYDISVCEICPARETCKPGHVGFLDWLEEAEE